MSEEIVACVGCYNQLVKHVVQLGFKSIVSEMIPNHVSDPRERSRTRWTRNVKCDRSVRARPGSFAVKLGKERPLLSYPRSRKSSSRFDT